MADQVHPLLEAGVQQLVEDGLAETYHSRAGTRVRLTGRGQATAESLIQTKPAALRFYLAIARRCA